MTERRSESRALVYADDYEIDNGDGTITVLPGNPRYCQQEQAHDGHEVHYAYLSRQWGTVTGAYYCTGEPAPWASDIGSHNGASDD